MNYIGSKAKLLSFIESTILNPKRASKHFCDLFAGSGVVSAHFARRGFCITSNDQEYYSYILNRAFLQTHSLEKPDEIIAYLNHLPPKKGFIYHHYCLGSGSGRCYFSDENGQKIDAIREAIEQYKDDEILYFYLLASLLMCADRVANTTSVYSAFLKKLKPLASAHMVLEGAPYLPFAEGHSVFCEDANMLISHLNGDILYLDPPYNRRQYGANYHLLNTIAFYDQTFIPRGKTGVRSYQSSPYCKAKTALDALEEIVAKAKFPYLYVSYNNEGLLQREQIAEMMAIYGAYTHVTQEHKRFKAYHNGTNKCYIVESIHILEKI